MPCSGGSNMKQRILFMILAGLAGASGPLQAEDAVAWQKVSSTHFQIMHTGDEALAKTVSERAESYYSTIASDLGYTRYQNFWLWDNRLRILIYPNAQAFSSACQAPAWAAGQASYKKHEIASYRQSGEGFLSSLLPHELSHLILADFIGAERVPLWLTEGFAQWEQSAHDTIPSLPPRIQRFKLRDLMVMDIRRDNDRQRVAIFNCECASITGFLIKTYGGESFGTFCRAIRDGKTCEAALAAAYPNDAPTVEALEERWLKAIAK